MLFELAFGLKVNSSQTKLGGVGVSKPQMVIYAIVLNCDIMKLSFTYLGLTIKGNQRRANF